MGKPRLAVVVGSDDGGSVSLPVMPITVDCGENKHDLCTGTGRTAYLIPQESRGLDEPPFDCGCTCHHKPDAKVPCRECQPLLGEETFGGVVLTDHLMGGTSDR